jgi:hypothetical protein
LPARGKLTSQPVMSEPTLSTPHWQRSGDEAEWWIPPSISQRSVPQSPSLDDNWKTGGQAVKDYAHSLMDNLEIDLSFPLAASFCIGNRRRSCGQIVAPCRLDKASTMTDHSPQPGLILMGETGEPGTTGLDDKGLVRHAEGYGYGRSMGLTVPELWDGSQP